MALGKNHRGCFKAALFRIAAVMITLILLLIAGEVVVRVFELVPPRLHQRDAVLGTVLIPGQSGVWRTQGRRIRVEINALGFRGPEIEIDKKGRYRVLIIGDSQVEALNMPYEDTFMAILQRRFKARGLPIEIVPMAVSNYSTAQEYLLYEKWGRRLKPDLVILCFFVGNDYENNHRPLWPDDRPYFDLKNGKLVRLPFKHRQLNTNRFRDWMRKNIRLYTLIPNLIKQLVKVLKPKPAAHQRVVKDTKKTKAAKTKVKDRSIWRKMAGWFSPPVMTALDRLLRSGRSELRYATTNLSPMWNRAYKITNLLILKFSGAVRADGGRFFLVDIPWYGQMYDKPWRRVMKRVGADQCPPGIWGRFNPQHRFLAFSRQSGVAFYPMAFGMRRVIVSSGRKFFDGVHFVEAGHRFAADFLEPIIKRYYSKKRSHSK